MANEPETATPAHAEFSQALDTLKKEGSNVLLVGADTVDAHDAICHRLLGETESRYRVFITNGDTRSASHGNGEGIHSAQTIDYATIDPPTAAVDADLNSPLGAIGIELIDAIEEVETEAGGLAPSELRVCVDSLVSLLQDHSAENVFRLLHMMTAKVAHSDGMGHYHLPLDRDHDAVNLFEPLFDAIVEVRSTAEGYEQRWELPDRETETEWLEL